MHSYKCNWLLFFSYSGPKGSNFSGRSPRREEHKVYIKNVPLDMDKVSCCSFKNRIYNNNKNMKVKYSVYRNPTISTLSYSKKPKRNTVFLKDKGAVYMCIPKLLELAPQYSYMYPTTKKLSLFFFIPPNELANLVCPFDTASTCTCTCTPLKRHSVCGVQCVHCS